MCRNTTPPPLSHSDFAISRNISRLVIKPLADPRAGNAISMPVARLRARFIPIFPARVADRCENKERKGEGGQIKHLDRILKNRYSFGSRRKWKSHKASRYSFRTFAFVSRTATMHLWCNVVPIWFW